MLKNIGRATGRFLAGTFQGVARNIGFGFGLSAGFCLAVGTYAWGVEVGSRRAAKEYENAEKCRPYFKKYPWGQPMGEDLTETKEDE